tara:strand:+ start:578 stop:943 length:366 start_codon:yes stop_codon:yes gene_type:complete
MSKAFLVASAALISGSAAFAGPYVNVENNAGFLGSDYAGSVTDLAIGYDTNVGENATIGAQIGPAFVNPDGDVDGSTQISGKVFGDIDLNEKFNIYAELAGLSSEDTDNLYNLKAGATWRF